MAGGGPVERTVASAPEAVVQLAGGIRSGDQVLAGEDDHERSKQTGAGGRRGHAQPVGQVEGDEPGRPPGMDPGAEAVGDDRGQGPGRQGVDGGGVLVEDRIPGPVLGGLPDQEGRARGVGRLDSTIPPVSTSGGR